MRVEQIAVFLENKSGRLAEITAVLADNGINIRALSVADTADFGILRLIVDKVELAKKVLKEIMDSDPRVLKKPAPAVYVMELDENGVNLSARCWVENAKYLRVLSDVTEKVKLRFDEEKLTLVHPQRDVHLIREPEPAQDDSARS